ncbi:GDSL esterase/lipase EXL3-like [Prosopis cineraria]|uniref:GDSL esterase/lipase EXL3-like n=1 Tax=Prosopis cineraria TaxID=364024 RepID=UPI00240FEDA0|nr:GDSL esterase/lipase EXL3-like [Prosopis cineraria]
MLRSLLQKFLLPLPFPSSVVTFWYCSAILIIIIIFQQSTIIISSSIVSLPNNETIPAVIVFGDSIVDTGNNNYINTMVKCNFLPYGRDFGPGNLPTGRFSNGMVPSDIIAAKFGVTQLLPPYLDPELKLEDLLTGVSFASGGAGYDPLTAELVSVLSLSDQLEMFKKYVEKIREAVGESKAGSFISKSIYIVCVGSDDIANTYIQYAIRRAQYDISSYTDFMAAQALSFLQELYGLGARRIGVFNIPVLGCVPSQRTIEGGLQRECSEFANQAAALFNSKLSSLIDTLHKNLPDARLVYLDSYTPFLHMLQRPAQYGFEVIEKGCCGSGNIEVSILCNPYTLEMCSNDKNYIFWDSYHPTEKAYSILASLVIDPKINHFF